MKKYIRSTSSTFSLQRIPWEKYIPGDALDRLADCRNRKSDLKVLRDALYQYILDNNQQDNFGIEDAAELALEWVGDWNNQYTLTDLTVDEYNRFVKGK